MKKIWILNLLYTTRKLDLRLLASLRPEVSKLPWVTAKVSAGFEGSSPGPAVRTSGKKSCIWKSIVMKIRWVQELVFIFKYEWNVFKVKGNIIS